jgi:endonuclease/exonuclease/phosphatase family metal-dependent hydrolase
VELGTIDFKKCHKDDCFARKGALLLGGEWQGQPFQILGTHLEAGPDHIKDVQYRELAGLLEYHWTPGVPQLLCGDFNTNSADPEQYGEMLSVLQAWNGPLLSEIQHTSSDGDEIDYILLRNADTNVVQVDRYVREFESEWKEDKAWLSDHLAVEAFVWFKKP